MAEVISRVAQLPDLVIATVLMFLPMSHVVPLVDVDSREIRELARRRVWLRVDTEWSFYGYTHGVSTRWVDLLVRRREGPPYRMQHLRYVVGDEVSPLFMSPQWQAWVTQYVGCLSLVFDVREENRDVLAAVLPELERLPCLVRLEMHADGTVEPFWPDELACMALPHGLTLLVVFPDAPTQGSLRELRLPDTLTSLVLATTASSPRQLPRLPAGLQKLFLRGIGTADMSPFVASLPRGLRHLYVDTLASGLVGGILLLVADQLPARLAWHNLVVVASTPPDYSCLSGIRIDPHSKLFPQADKLAEDDSLCCSVGEATDLSGCVFPRRIKTLLVENGAFPFRDEVATGDYTASVAYIAAQSSMLEEVRVNDHGGIDWDRLALPATVKACFLNGSSPTTPVLAVSHPLLQELNWELPVLAPPVDQLLSTGLTQLSLLGCTVEPGFVFPPTLKTLRFSFIPGGLPPLQHVVLVEKVVIDMESYEFAKLDVAGLPPNLQSLELMLGPSNATPDADAHERPQWRSGVVAALASAFTSVTVSFAHLSQLNRLVVEGWDMTGAASIEFPESLREFRCRDCRFETLDGVHLPAALEKLAFNHCGLANPWTHHRVRPSRFPLLFARAVPEPCLPFPDSLVELDLSSNHDLEPPPLGFAFPPRLQILDIMGADIDDITPYRFPDGLRTLNLLGNFFPLPSDYVWPRALVELELRRWLLDETEPVSDELLRELGVKLPATVVHI